MGGRVLFALSIAAFPEELPRDVLTAIFAGASAKVREAGGTLAGGHTIRDPEPKYGLAVIGAAHPDRLLRKGGARPGDRLVLTKPLGTGILVSGGRQGRTSEADLAGAIDGMRRLNRAASEALVAAGVRTATDVTGFGLLGHGLEMARASGARFVFEAAALPALPGALALAADGVETGGAAHNRRFVARLARGRPGRARRARHPRPRPADLGRAAGGRAARLVAAVDAGARRRRRRPLVDRPRRGRRSGGCAGLIAGARSSAGASTSHGSVHSGSRAAAPVTDNRRPVPRAGPGDGGSTCAGSSSRSSSTPSCCSSSSCSSGSISVPQPFPFGPDSAPIVELRGAGLIGFLSWAAILVLVNRFARPVLVALTGRLLFSTMGLFVVIINAIAIWLTAFIAPIKIATVAEPPFLWIIVAAALYTGLSTVADAVLGLNRPTFSPDDGGGTCGASSSRCRRRAATSIIENLRLQQVYDAIYTTSLDIALADTPDRGGPSLVPRGWSSARRTARRRDRRRSASGPCSSSSARPT